jgi:hypothetical protein
VDGNDHVRRSEKVDLATLQLRGIGVVELE